MRIGSHPWASQWRGHAPDRLCGGRQVPRPLLVRSRRPPDRRSGARSLGGSECGNATPCPGQFPWMPAGPVPCFWRGAGLRGRSLGALLSCQRAPVELRQRHRAAFIASPLVHSSVEVIDLATASAALAIAQARRGSRGEVTMRVSDREVVGHPHSRRVRKPVSWPSGSSWRPVEASACRRC
jgi:hypothetical protein